MITCPKCKCKFNPTPLGDTNKHYEHALAVVAYLNEVTGSRYRETKASMGPILARLKEGFTHSECIQVIDTMWAEWNGTEWEKFMRPITLFSPSKFESYLNRKPASSGGIDWSKA